MNNKTCIVILSILVIGCYSTPAQRTRRQSETATELSEEKELSLEKLETFDSENNDKQDSPVPAAHEVVESDKEKVGDDKNDDPEESGEVEKKEEIEEISEAKEPSVPAAEEEDSDDEDDESAVAPKGVEELYQESKAEFEKNDKEEESGAKKGSAASDNENDDELQSAIGDVAPAAGGMFSAFSQMWQTVTTLGSSWEHWTRIFNAFTALAGF